ncbi:MAG TPA: FKBP-type peptidyl-prolyl cis-trans isomerase [Mycobacteriales bacterium]|nr:FKBP-type peptidyl-prolyl cis-trans isomerase [Mycobacteriales bacterium]
MATSRRRERELARRRFEQRRQAEIERRARAKRRNTVIGASVGTVAVIGIVVAIVIALANGSGKSSANAASSPSSSPSPSASSTTAPPAPTKCAKIVPNPPAAGEPKVPNITGKPPTKLVSKDLKVGSGPAVKDGDKVTVRYVGVACSTGKSFDASYTDGAKNKEFSFTVGQGSVIKGWDKGVVGMKAGGVRQLINPAAYGYGAAGSPPAIKGNETLNFVVTMVQV